MTAAAAPVLVDDRHVRPGAYVLSIDRRLYAVVERRVNYGGQTTGRAEALVEDVSTPTREQRYLDPVQVSQRPLKWRPVRLSTGELVDAAADTMAAWLPVTSLVGWELIRAPTGMGVSRFAEP